MSTLARNARKSIIQHHNRSIKYVKTEPNQYSPSEVSRDYRSSHRESTQLRKAPNFESRIILKEEQTLNNIYKHRKFVSRYRYELKPLKRPEPVQLLRPSNPSGKLNYYNMPSSRQKLTSRFETQLENIRLVERLLTLKPTKQLCKSEHRIFYQQHKKHKSNIQHRFSLPMQQKKSLFKQQWKNV